ncbi:hypothetical protein CMUST_15225 [Corynebacterium mustelae]|uniref:Uncharacterized protein n=1 Tax=Corynebacterium mustelae TaxID=571915 RepID=A0A0G3H1P4_9CORY|nr:hypothetical protein CMUST_15225 [Corynebacterium mustelae]
MAAGGITETPVDECGQTTGIQTGITVHRFRVIPRSTLVVFRLTNGHMRKRDLSGFHGV